MLDGYDLGVGMLLRGSGDAQQDRMIASIGPFWDANETWLVLGVGLLLVAFPLAHGIVLGALYLPVAVMLVGLILRGVAFDFRVKVDAPATRPGGTGLLRRARCIGCRSRRAACSASTSSASSAPPRTWPSPC